MDRSQLKKLLQELILAPGPSGQEEAVAKVCKKHLKGTADTLFEDDSGNLIACIKGKSKDPEKAIHLMTHMDELSLIVKRINEDGSLRLDPLGGIYPFDLGQGPVEILGDKKSLPGIVSAPSIHTSEETSTRWRSMPRGEDKSLRWQDMHVFTGKSEKELEKAGVHPGTRVVIAPSRRELEEVGACYAGYFMDNRAAIAIGIATLKGLKKRKPKYDVYLALTTEEEIGAHGASFAARTLPGHTSIAIDVGPVAEEYQTELTGSPIVVYQDTFTVYHKKTADALEASGKKLKLKPQRAIWSGYGSDASLAKRHGQTGKAALLCIPTKNTHGFEIIHRDGMQNCAKMLIDYLGNA